MKKKEEDEMIFKDPQGLAGSDEVSKLRAVVKKLQ